MLAEGVLIGWVGFILHHPTPPTFWLPKLDARAVAAVGHLLMQQAAEKTARAGVERPGSSDLGSFCERESAPISSAPRVPRLVWVSRLP